jgi:hypothetical protein
LTSEVLKVAPSGQRYYAKPTGETRNEAIDTRILAYASVEILDPNYAVIAKKLSSTPQNDWREKEAVLAEVLAAPIPDLREEKAQSVNDVDISALRNRLAQKNKSWMDDVR